jgi:hypothetical protein
MENKNRKKPANEPEKAKRLHVLGEVLRAHRRNTVIQAHRPCDLEGKEAQREHDAEVKRLEYQLGYALHSSLEALRIPADSWQWYLDLLQQYAVRISADFSNCQQVAREVYELIKAHRDKQPATGSLVVTGLVNIEEENEWPDNFENYAY